MEIISLTESIIEYLLVSSALLLILGLVSFLFVQSMKIQGRAKLWVCTLILILPLAYPVKTLFPESFKVPVHLQLSYFQPRNEITVKKPLSMNTVLTADKKKALGVTGIGGTKVIADEPLIPGLKERFMETVPGIFRDWRLPVTILWGLIFSFSLIRLFTMVYKTNRFLKLAEPVTNSQVLKLLHQCASDTGMRHTPRLYKVDSVATPVVMGIFRPGIIIPKHLFQPEFREGLQFTLLHELKHLHQHHNWWLLVESIIGAAYFFHPVIHWAKEKIHEELEHICDSHVVNITNKSVSYADFLLHEIWNQNLARNPALALPFVSTVLKTTIRIHSVLENARPAPFMNIRNRLAIFSVFMAFSSILILSIVPTVQHPKKALNILSSPITHSQEITYHETDIAEPKKEVSMAEKSSTHFTGEKSSHIEKVSSAIKSENIAEDAVKIIQEKPINNQVLDTENRKMATVTTEHEAEGIPDNQNSNFIPLSDQIILANIVDNSISSAQNVTTAHVASDVSGASETVAQKYLGPPVNELTINRINDIRILDEYTILFVMRGGAMYLTRLSYPCPGLLYASDFNILSNNGRISKFDRIQALSNGQVTGTTGELGDFYPYGYEGDKTAAIKHLKKSLLAKFITEGAFK